MPPAPKDIDCFVSETTSFIKKSLSNSSIALLSPHEIARNDLEVQLQPLCKKHSTRSQRLSKGCERATNAYKVILGLLFSGTLLTALVLAGIILGPSWIDGRGRDDVSADRGRDGASADGNIVPSGDRFPFSLLDPVHDLGLAEHERSPEDSSFPAYFYGGDSNPNSDGEHPRQAKPTNAWYQNLLQVQENDEPSNVQRAYPGPYLMDVVGMIPGLSVHATDIDASDMVVQLSFNERFSVVLGGTDSILPGKSEGDVATTLTHSHKYKVVKTTDLGITLGWVSYMQSKLL